MSKSSLEPMAKVSNCCFNKFLCIFLEAALPPNFDFKAAHKLFAFCTSWKLSKCLSGIADRRTLRALSFALFDWLAAKDFGVSLVSTTFWSPLMIISHKLLSVIAMYYRIFMHQRSYSPFLMIGICSVVIDGVGGGVSVSAICVIIRDLPWSEFPHKLWYHL